MKSTSLLKATIVGGHSIGAFLLALLMYELSECAVGYLSTEIGPNRIPVLMEVYHNYVASSYLILTALYVSPLAFLLMTMRSDDKIKASWLVAGCYFSLTLLVGIATIYPIAMPILQFWSLPYW